MTMLIVMITTTTMMMLMTKVALPRELFLAVFRTDLRDQLERVQGVSGRRIEYMSDPGAQHPSDVIGN